MAFVAVHIYKYHNSHVIKQPMNITPNKFSVPVFLSAKYMCMCSIFKSGHKHNKCLINNFTWLDDIIVNEHKRQITIVESSDTHHHRKVMECPTSGCGKEKKCNCNK